MLNITAGVIIFLYKKQQFWHGNHVRTAVFSAFSINLVNSVKLSE